MKTAYKPIPSPYQAMRKRSFNTQDNKHPVRTEIQKFLGSYQLGVEFQEDQETLTRFKHIPGVIALLCTLRKDGQVIGLGRGVAVVNRINRIVERTTSMAINGAFMSACNNATKVLDSLRLEPPIKELGQAYSAKEEPASDLATDKQKNYLRELILLNVEDSREQEQRIMQLDELTRSEASTLIQAYAKVG